MRDELLQFKNLKAKGITLSELSRRKINSAAYGVVNGAKLNLMASLDSFALIVVADGAKALQLSEKLAQYGTKTVVLSAPEEALLYNKAQSREFVNRRLSALYRILERRCDAAVVTVDGLAAAVPAADRFADAVTVLKKDTQRELVSVVTRLVYAGYRRESVVENPGQFSLRGDILDVFPVNYKSPVRIEFFDNYIERIRAFSIDSGKSFKELDIAEVAPATDFLLYEDESAALIKKIEETAQNTCLEADRAERLKSILSDITMRITAGSREPALKFVAPLADIYGSLTDYLPQDCIVVLDEEKQLTDRAQVLYAEHNSRCETLLQVGEILPQSVHQYVPKERLFKQLGDYPAVSFNLLGQSTLISAPQKFDTNTGPVRKYSLNFKELAKDISNWIYGGYKVALLAATDEAAADMEYSLRQNGVQLSMGGTIGERAGAWIFKADLQEGFINHTDKFVLIASGDIQPKTRAKSVRRRKKDVFLTPEVGDFIVHEVHGIGVCEGIKKLNAGGIIKDYIVIKYRDGDTLYVPCDQMDLIARYAGSDTAPKLNKLGGKEFEKLKARVKKHIREMAFDLRQLYAQRRESKGFAFAPDSPLQAEFEDAFEHVETEDQLHSAAEIKADMESPQVMDRLLCGDVGYGKTEVALRAAFKAIENGKQVAFLSPTTILSQQHYNLCEQRFAPFGVRVDSLNRFKSPAQQKQSLDRLKEGQTDLIVGTHRLLSKDVAFSDLGLLIVDEEQRFGVEDKEKIKNLKTAVDVLSLSATPIPRTLHMSLSGIRDISVLDTPPRERLPVQTYVLEYSDALLHDAIARELARGGQAFVLYNRVDGIERFAHKVAQITPDARIATAHGQMTESNLESAIENFYKGDTDVLICTTIIENGIDIPSVNTLIVIESDRLGLSQLYQLRGRVGRSNRLAHVYFTYIPDKVLTENAYKRLKAIMEFTELGSGFKVAMRDLEIRGAGNVLGRQQHGHMENIGYDMYCRLLQQSVSEMGGDAPEQQHIESDISADAYIPEKYIEDGNQRLKAYQKIAGMESVSERPEIYAELADIYGTVPQSVENLLNIALIKLLCTRLKATFVSVKTSGCLIKFSGMEILQNDRFMAAVQKFSDLCALNFSEGVPALVFKGQRSGDAALVRLAEFLQTAAV